jgi:hypothetical protein
MALKRAGCASLGKEGEEIVGGVMGREPGTNRMLGYAANENMVTKFLRRQMRFVHVCFVFTQLPVSDETNEFYLSIV